MKQVSILITCFFLLGFSSFSQNKSKSAKPEKRLEDQIKQYWFVMLTKGTVHIDDSIVRGKLQKEHLANINRLYYEGKIKVAGPFGDNGNWRGIFIFDCGTKEEVEKLLNTDAAIAAGTLTYEIHSWWTAPIGSFTPGIPEKPKE